MANKIKGITIKIGGDTIDLDKALKGVNKESVGLNSELNQINRQLKFDPSSAVLLSQKQEVLKESINAAKEKLKELENVQQDIERQYEKGEIDGGQYRAYQREVEQTKDKIKSYETQLNSTKQTQQDFNRKIEAARATLDKNKETLKSGAKSLMKWGAAATAAATGGLFKIAENAVETTDNIDKMSQKIGISRQAYQELDFICSQTGANVDNLKMGLKTMRSVMDTTAQGTSKQRTALERLGISAVDMSGKLRNSEEVMWEAFSVLQQWDNESEKARLATMLFGRAGSDLMPLLNGNAESINRMKNKAHELGLILSDEAIDSGVEFKDTLDQTKRSLEAAGNKMAVAFLPALSDILKKLQDHMPEIQAHAEKLGKKIGDDITWLIDNGDTVIKMIKITGIEAGGIWAAVKTYKFTQFIGETVSAMKMLKTATEAQKVATVSATAATEAETVAQEGLNVAMSANVIGAVISGLIVLGSTIWAVCSATEETTEATHELSEEEKEFNETVEEQTEKLKGLKDTRKETIEQIHSEYDYYQNLYTELQNITDENGKVKKGLESRAKFITNTLAEAFGVEFEWNGKIIQNYEDMKTKLEDLMKQKELYAQQEAFTDEYKNAVQNVETYGQNYQKAKNALPAVEYERDYLKERLKKIKEYQKKILDGRITVKDTVATLKDLAEEERTLKKELGSEDIENSVEWRYRKAKQNLKDTEKAYVESVAIIKNYSKLSTAIISGDEEKISGALLSLKNNFINSTTGTKETLTQQVQDFQESYDLMKQALADGVPGVTQEMVDGQKTMLDRAKLALEHWCKNNKDSYTKAGEDVQRSFIHGVNINKYPSFQKLLKKNAKKPFTIIQKELKEASKKVRDELKKEGTNFIEGYIEGLNTEGLKRKYTNGGKSAVLQLSKSVAKAQDSHSPAKKAMPLGADWAQGYYGGMETEATKSAKKTGQKLVNSISAQMKQVGSGGIDVNANLNYINDKLAPFTYGGAFTSSSTSKIINNTPDIHISFGAVSVRSNEDINRLAKRVSEEIAQTIELKGASMGL